jgi:hypothetical protein
VAARRCSEAGGAGGEGGGEAEDDRSTARAGSGHVIGRPFQISKILCDQ